MLTAEQRELIAAAVDGELSAPEARAFRKLLEASAAARDLFAKLTADRERVRALPLPQAAPPADLRARVMARVAATTPAPRPVKVPAAAARSQPVPLVHPAPVRARPNRPVPAWVPVAAAASLLLAVALGSFAYFRTSGPSKSDVAKQPWSNALPAPREAPHAVPSPNAPRPRPEPDDAAHADLTPVPPLPMPKEVAPPAVAVAPAPRPARHDLIASPLLPPIPPFDRIEVRVPFLRAVSDLGRDDTRQELRDELADEPAYRFDLFVRDTARGVDVFRTAAKAAGLHLFADAATTDKLKKRQAHAVVVYVECLTRDELADLFAKVSAADMKFTPRVCDSLHATAAGRVDEVELKAVLGIDAGLYKRPRTTGAGHGGTLLDKNGDPKSVSAGTIDSVTKSLKAPPAKPGEKPAVLMTWQTTHPAITRTNPAMSSELKQFLAKRGERKPNAIPAIIVIRPAG